MLSDEQILKIADECGLLTMVDEEPLWFDADCTNFARRIESAVLAGAGEPVAFVAEVYQSRYTIELNGHDLAEGAALYLHPSPTPEGMVLVPENVEKAGYEIAHRAQALQIETLQQRNVELEARILQVISAAQGKMIAATSGKGE